MEDFSYSRARASPQGYVNIEDGNSIPGSLPRPQDTCPHHQHSKLELYCESCGTVICFKCTIRTHNGHHYNLVSELPKDKRKLAFLLQPTESKVECVESALTTLDTRQEEVTELKHHLEAKIEEFANKLHEAIDVRKRELTLRLMEVTHTKLKALATERDTKETMHAQLGSATIKLRDSLSRNAVEMLKGKKNLVSQVRSVSTEFKDQKNLLEIDTTDDVCFVVPKNAIKKCEEFGRVFTPDSLDPQRFVATGRGLEAALVEEATIIFVTAYDHKGEVYNNMINSLECKLIPEDSEGAKCRVQSLGAGLYEMSYKPMIRGTHQLQITVEKEHIKGSPFIVRVKPSLEQLCGPIHVIEEDVFRPWGIAINSEDKEVIVTEWSVHRVSIFNLKGDRMSCFGEHGSGPNQLDHPRGVAVDEEGNIFVIDGGNRRVQKFTRQGHLLASSSERTGNRRKVNLTDPNDLAFNITNSKVYVSDVTRIQVLNSDLTFDSMFGSKGSAKEQFVSAFGVSCDLLGNIYVSDNSNNSVQIFTSGGQFLRVLQSEGAPSPRGFVKGLLGGKVPTSAVCTPTGITIDDSRRVYVSSEHTHQVAIVSPDGQWVWSLGKEGFTSGEFKRPRGIAVSNDGSVYICDFENSRVQVF